MSVCIHSVSNTFHKGQPLYHPDLVETQIKLGAALQPLELFQWTTGALEFEGPLREETLIFFIIQAGLTADTCDVVAEMFGLVDYRLRLSTTKRFQYLGPGSIEDFASRVAESFWDRVFDPADTVASWAQISFWPCVYWLSQDLLKKKTFEEEHFLSLDSGHLELPAGEPQMRDSSTLDNPILVGELIALLTPCAKASLYPAAPLWSGAGRNCLRTFVHGSDRAQPLDGRSYQNVKRCGLTRSYEGDASRTFVALYFSTGYYHARLGHGEIKAACYGARRWIHRRHHFTIVFSATASENPSWKFGVLHVFRIWKVDGNLMSTTPRTLTLSHVFFCLVLLPAFLCSLPAKAAAQSKGTCLVNNKVTYDCDLSKFKDSCFYNGQILPCNKTPEKSCGDSGPLIIKLNEATRYYERWPIYDAMGLNLDCRGISVGFFGAASDVTHDFAADLFGIGKEADAFLSSVSTRLAQMNVHFFKELVDTGNLKTADGQGYLTSGANIDRELVKREQALVQEELDKLSAADKAKLTQQINAKIARWIWSTSPSAKAMAQVRDSKRKTDPEAQFDYSDINDRIAVGNILAAERRKNPIRIRL